MYLATKLILVKKYFLKVLMKKKSMNLFKKEMEYFYEKTTYLERLFEDSVSLAWGKCYWNFNYKRRDFISLSKFKVREII